MRGRSCLRETCIIIGINLKYMHTRRCKQNTNYTCSTWLQCKQFFEQDSLCRTADNETFPSEHRIPKQLAKFDNVMHSSHSIVSCIALTVDPRASLAAAYINRLAKMDD